MNFGIALDLDGRVQQVGVSPEHVRHRAHRHRVRHARVRRELADHVRLAMVVGVQRLADEEVALAAAQLVVIEGVGERLELDLVGQFRRQLAERAPQPIVGDPVRALEAVVDGAPDAESALGCLLPGRLAHGRVQQVVEPGRHRRRDGLGTLLFQPALDVVVAVALVRLQPELAGDLHPGLHAQPIDFDRAPALPHLAQRPGEVAREQVPAERGPLARRDGAIAEDAVQVLDRVAEHQVGLAWRDLVGAGEVLEVGEHVRAEDRPDEAGGERHVDLEPATVDRSLIELVLREQEQPEIPEADRVERHLVRLVVLAEAAGAARSRGEEDELLPDLLGAARSDFGLQEVHEVAGGERGGAARADVDQCLAGIQIGPRDVRQRLRVVAQVLHRALHQPLVLPRQPAEQDRHVLPLVRRERPCFVRLVVRDRCARCCHTSPREGSRLSGQSYRSCGRDDLAAGLQLSG